MAQETPHPKKAMTGKQAAVEMAAATKGSAKRHWEEQGSSPEERHRMIAEAAYLIAEQRDFQGDMALDDWLQAKAEVDAQFAARH